MGLVGRKRRENGKKMFLEEREIRSGKIPRPNSCVAHPDRSR